MKRLTEIRDLRAEVLEALTAAKVPMQLLDLSKNLRLRAGSDDYEYLRSLLEQMAEEGTIIRMSRRRFGLPQQADRKSTRLNSSHVSESRMPSSA